MGEYVVRSKKVFKDLSAIKEEIKQLLIDGAKNEDVIEKYVSIIVEKFSDYKKSYLINNRNVHYSEIPVQKTTVVGVFELGMQVKNPEPHNLFNTRIPFDKGNEVCEVIVKKLRSIGFFSEENIIEKAKEDDEVLKKLIENRLYNELIKVGKSSRMKDLFKKFGDFDYLIEFVSANIIFDLDLVEIIDFETVYGGRLDSLLDIVNKKFIDSEYQSIRGDGAEDDYESNEHERYRGYREKLLNLGAKTKYEIIFEQAKDDKTILVNKLLKKNLTGIYSFTNSLNDEKLVDLYYIVITLLQVQHPKVLKQVIGRINEVIFEGIFNVKNKWSTNFTSYFFSENRYEITRRELVSIYSDLGDESYRLNYLAFNEKNLPRLEKPYIYDFEFIFFNTKKIDRNVIKFLIRDEGMKDLFFNYFDAIEFSKIIKEYSCIVEMKEFFIARFFCNGENEFLIRVDILDRNIYNLYIYADNKELKNWFIGAFEKLEIKDKLKFLSQRDYLGRNTLHYAFLKEDKEMLEVISKLSDDKSNQKELDGLAKETDYFNRLPGEYNKTKELDINKGLVLGKEKRTRGSFTFLYGPSILDIIDIMVSEKGSSYKGELIVGNDLYSEIDDRLKYYKDKEIKVNDRYINFKRLLEYTDNINISKEKSIKRSLRTTFKDEGYKFIHVLQRLGYSIVKTESKSNVILKKFEELNQRFNKLDEIKEIILTNLMATLGSVLYYDSEDILKVYHEESQELTRREKANIESPTNNLKFIVQNDLEDIIDYYTKNQLPSYENEDEVYKNIEIVDKLTEVLYGERVLILFKNLNDLCKTHNNIESENIIWKFLKLNEEVEINHKSKVVRVWSRDSITREYQYYLKGKGYEIEII